MATSGRLGIHSASPGPDQWVAQPNVGGRLRPRQAALLGVTWRSVAGQGLAVSSLWLGPQGPSGALRACPPRSPRSPPHTPVGQLLGDEQVPQVVLGRAFVVLQQRVGVAQAVAGLRLHRLVFELSGQLQRLPARRGGSAPTRRVLGAPFWPLLAPSGGADGGCGGSSPPARGPPALGSHRAFSAALLLPDPPWPVTSPP